MIPVLSRINQVLRIDTYFFKIRSNIVFSSSPRPSRRLYRIGLCFKTLGALLHYSILAECPVHLNLLDLIILIILGE